MQRLHNCVQSTMIEVFIFGGKSPEEIPNEDCPICLEPLNSKNPKPQYGCSCGYYPKKLKKCSHWMHVSCQIDKNPNWKECPICKQSVFMDK